MIPHVSACSLWSGIICLYSGEKRIIPWWGWCASAALQIMVIAIRVTPIHSIMQDGVQGQELDPIILEGPFQLSLFWDSPSDAAGTFLWRLNQHSFACLPLCLPSSPGQRVQTPITKLFSCRVWGKICSLQSQQYQCWKGENPATGLLEVSGLYFSVWDEVVALWPWPNLMREETHLKRLQWSR